MSTMFLFQGLSCGIFFTDMPFFLWWDLQVSSHYCSPTVCWCTWHICWRAIHEMP